MTTTRQTANQPPRKFLTEIPVKRIKCTSVNSGHSHKAGNMFPALSLFCLLTLTLAYVNLLTYRLKNSEGGKSMGDILREPGYRSGYGELNASLPSIEASEYERSLRELPVLHAV